MPLRRRTVPRASGHCRAVVEKVPRCIEMRPLVRRGSNLGHVVARSGEGVERPDAQRGVAGIAGSPFFDRVGEIDESGHGTICSLLLLTV